MSKTRFHQVRKLPLILQPNSFYFVENREQDAWDGWLTNKRGEKAPIGNTELIAMIANNSTPTTPLDLNEVVDYRSEYNNLYIYSGFLLNDTPIIKRCKDNTEEFASNVVDLESDWTNRLTLTYN